MTVNTTNMLSRYTTLRDEAASAEGTRGYLRTGIHSPEAWQYAINKVRAVEPEQFPLPGDAYDIDNMPYGLSVHIKHCCSRHGCKYAHEQSCAVVLGEFEQDHQCEFCESDKARATEDRHADTKAHLLALDGVLGYMHRRLKDADQTSPFVKGYDQAYSDVAHIRSQIWFDWHREDREAAKDHKQDWDAIHASEPLGTSRIFPPKEATE